MKKPVRIQLSCRKGFRMQDMSPDGRPVVKVARPGKWGNPFTVKSELKAGYKPEDCASMAVFAFQEWLKGSQSYSGFESQREYINSNITDLAGKHLACFCPLDKPCHADVLLRMAYKPMTLIEEIDNALDILARKICEGQTGAIVIYESLEADRSILINRETTMDRIRARGNKSAASPRACAEG